MAGLGSASPVDRNARRSSLTHTSKVVAGAFDPDSFDDGFDIDGRVIGFSHGSLKSPVLIERNAKRVPLGGSPEEED